MKYASIVVRAVWDDQSGVWVATSNDVNGLVVEAETLEALQPKVHAALTGLLALNGSGCDLPEIPVHIMAENLSRIPNPCL